LKSRREERESTVDEPDSWKDSIGTRFKIIDYVNRFDSVFLSNR